MKSAVNAVPFLCSSMSSMKTRSFKKPAWRVSIRQSLVLLFVLTYLAGPANATTWELQNGGLLVPNRATTITLVRTSAGKTPQTTQTVTSPGSQALPDRLWLTPADSANVVMPEYADVKNNRADVPIFVRGSRTVSIELRDSINGTSQTITRDVKRVANSSGEKPWLPRLTIQGEDGLPVTLANQSTTVVLELVPGAGAMPASAQIVVRDSRDRTVISRFFNTFELAAGSETITIPAAGEYNVITRLLADPTENLPRARYRTPVPIPYGQTEARFEVSEPRWLVTTQTVLGSRVALEQLPTTATVVAEDQMRMVVFGRHSNEIQRNHWPFAIAGSNLIDMPAAERQTWGVRLLKWQRRLGSSYAPVNVNWSAIQPNPGSFNWTDLNRTLPLYRKEMVRPLLTVTGPAAWEQNPPTETTATQMAWSTMIRHISSQYIPVVWALQPWNHPETVWKDPAQYAKFLLKTADAFQMPNGERIETPPLVTGSLAEFDTNYLGALLTPENKSRLGGIAFDLFPRYPQASPEQNGLERKVAYALDLLRSRQATGLKIYVTGSGWPVGPNGVTPELQANYLVRTHVSALANGAYKITWNSLCDSGTSGSSVASDGMGLLDANLVPRKSGVAYNLMTYALSGITDPGVSIQQNVRITSFNLPLQTNKWPGVIYVAWTNSPNQVQTIQLDMKHGGGVYAFDYLGAEVPAKKIRSVENDAIAGTYEFQIGYNPVYIWDAGKAPNRAPAGRKPVENTDEKTVWKK